MKQKSEKYWVWSLLLSIPVILVYIGHFYYSLKHPGQMATGFIVYDMAYYLSNAREYMDSGNWSIFYSNPFSHNYNSPSIYFQPQILLLAILWKITGLSPGYVFCLYGFLTCVIGFRISIALYERLVGMDSLVKKYGLVLFGWGGGVLAILGFLIYFLKSGDITLSLMRMHDLDPHYGWWFLNLGRNFIFPNESYYHILFFGSMLMVLNRQFKWALVLTGILSLSHPFTGIALVSIMIAWSFLERFYVQREEIPLFFIGFNCLILLNHLLYYIVYLPSYVEHAQLMEHWALDWSMKAINFIPAYMLVALFFFLGIKSPFLLKKYLSNWENRLLLTWFVVVFLLANHEFAFRPHQPLHFTRGYIWVSLFLLGRHAFIELLEYLWSGRKWLLLVCFSLIFLSDNITFMARQTWSQSVGNLGFHLTKDQQEVLKELNSPKYSGKLLIGEEKYMNYMASVYSPIRTWFSHDHNTPDVKNKQADIHQYFENCVEAKAWQSKALLYLFNKPIKKSCILGSQPVFENSSYLIYLKNN